MRIRLTDKIMFDDHDDAVSAIQKMKMMGENEAISVWITLSGSADPNRKPADLWAARVHAMW